MTARTDLALAARFAVLIALCAWVPVPILDHWLEVRVRRAWLRAQATRRGVSLSEEDVRRIADPPSAGCWGLFKAALWWPVKKLIRTVAVVFFVKHLADGLSEAVHRAMLVDEALSEGWLPGRADEVRRAMDAALSKVDTRLVERNLLGKLRDPKGTFNRAVWETAMSARRRAVLQRAEEDTIGPSFSSISAALDAVVERAGLMPEVLHWFRLEMERGAPNAPHASVEPGPTS